MNWSEVVKTIQSSGFSQHEIADYCGCQQSHISLLKRNQRGQNLTYEIGVKLIEMLELSPEKVTDIPPPQLTPNEKEDIKRAIISMVASGCTVDFVDFVTLAHNLSEAFHLINGEQTERVSSANGRDHSAFLAKRAKSKASSQE